MTTESIDELKRALTRHGDELQLYANGVAEDEIGSFELSESRIVILIYRLYEEYGRAGLQIDYKTQKFLNGLKKQLAAIRSILYDGIENDLEDELPELVEEENKFWKWFFGFGGLNAAMLERISKYGVYNGFTRKQIIEKVRQNDLERLYGTIAGESMQKWIWPISCAICGRNSTSHAVMSRPKSRRSSTARSTIPRLSSPGITD